MKAGSIDELILQPVSFLASAPADEADIAISSRIRLARNIAGFPFPGRATPDVREKLRGMVKRACRSRKLRVFDIENLDEIEREVLLERRLVSRELLQSAGGAAVVVREDERLSLMINEEDQLRLQAIQPGLALPELYREIAAVEEKLSAQLDFAFDDRLGYLCACPTNVGTGMRASVMLHLPALVLSGRIAPTMQGINKLQLAVRGIYGEHTQNLGNLFQISNQITLGESEGQILDRIGSVISDVIKFEKESREALLKQDRFGMLNHIGRAYGILRYSYRLGLSEALNCLSGLRAGVDMRLFPGMERSLVNRLFIGIFPGHLQKHYGEAFSGAELDIRRAEFCRRALAE